MIRFYLSCWTEGGRSCRSLVRDLARQLCRNSMKRVWVPTYQRNGVVYVVYAIEGEGRKNENAEYLLCLP
jgi:hypothetical protein